MAASQPTVGGLPNVERRSFAEVLAAKKQRGVALPVDSSNPEDPFPLTTGLHKGFPAAIFTSDQLRQISQTYDWSLVGKFSVGFNRKDPDKGRPSLEKIHNHLLALNLKGDFNVGLLDNRHVIIHLSIEEDYIRLYSRMVWNIGKIIMRIFRWTPHFRVDKESPLVPVWITMPRLPIMLFHQRVLFSIARLVGNPLRTDVATASMKRPSVARLLVEIDLLKPRYDKIWIQLGEDDGYWQSLTYENVPEYCSHCWHVGHSEQVCHILNSELRRRPQLPDRQPQNPVLKEVWREVGKGQATVVANRELPEDAGEGLSFADKSAVHSPPEIAAAASPPAQSPSAPAGNSATSDQHLLTTQPPAAVVALEAAKASAPTDQAVPSAHVLVAPAVFHPEPIEANPEIAASGRMTVVDAVAHTVPVVQAFQTLLTNLNDQHPLIVQDEETIVIHDSSVHELSLGQGTPSKKFRTPISHDDVTVGVRPNSKMVRMMSKVTSPNFLEPLMQDSLSPEAPQVTETIAQEPFMVPTPAMVPEDFEGSEFTDTHEEALFEVTVAQGDSNDSFKPVTSKKRGRGRPRKTTK